MTSSTPPPLSFAFMDAFIALLSGSCLLALAVGPIRVQRSTDISIFLDLYDWHLTVDIGFNLIFRNVDKFEFSFWIPIIVHYRTNVFGFERLNKVCK